MNLCERCEAKWENIYLSSYQWHDKKYGRNSGVYRKMIL